MSLARSVLTPASSRGLVAAVARLAGASVSSSSSSVGGIAARRSFTTTSADSIKVAAADDGSATTTITVAIKAGPRYESSPGVAHALKNFFFKANHKRSALALIREAELYGGFFSSSTTKEHILLTADFLRGDEDFFVEVLGDAVSQAKFARHEYSESVVPLIQSDAEFAAANPLVSGFDQLTSTAYRNRGLGASLFASHSSPISYSDVQHYAKSVLAKNNLAVLGSGIESEKLAKLVQQHFAPLSPSASSASTTKTPSTYYGGEHRVQYAPAHHDSSARASFGHVFLAFEGAANGASPELAVLRSLLGGESSVKWSKGQSPLSAISAQAPGATVSAFNLGFSDAGLFGIHVSAPHERIAAVAKSAMNALKEIASQSKVDDIKRAVAKAKFEAAATLEGRAASHEAVSSQLLESGSVSTLDSVFSALDKVDASALSKAAEKLLKSKPTTVVVGDVHKLPYADECL
ncbi:putative QCR2-40 kDa ubiquinol cytochrome-c reductase core protein 2 [Tilletiaria anomala UBC 951]|uniref:Cytochrome b-c1 complex subunit 2, mitochondrial n=1 Tax=Tilletiaria anomala (strain ATCC 24038 / CBS 436.72 / UBC 951) TaxID=1037660 RepID=A0A066VDZ7_TILAU|nr:putative QCR2-40 kDa ubiquinol cytochrome-c reductase core protein 2 [Tilletiaria anomala UBC 951]KDN39952.1 putative QCR2-40 kDa ubiquinol cytochrome-c reductase core protein 2 [Tilletiaria anomala UBC 951]